ncbi:pentapeptide repeat-containing protein, partial [Sulfitobacter sp. EhC04]|uniref:pentapeptide repeat-containing protein n=1 Tax=Sulfitobacter sp. EhC04 TaxID=1849168 RepID=UPI0010FD0738
AEVRGAQLQGAELFGAKLQGADLRRAQFDAATNLSTADLRGAALRSVDLTNVPQIAEHLEGLFGDGTVTLPEGMERPERFSVEFEKQLDFDTAWRAFQRSIGQDPADPK